MKEIAWKVILNGAFLTVREYQQELSSKLITNWLSWIRWKVKLVGRAGTAKCIMMVWWEHLTDLKFLPPAEV